MLPSSLKKLMIFYQFIIQQLTNLYEKLAQAVQVSESLLTQSKHSKQNHIMNSKLTYIALLSIAGLASIAAAESTGLITASGAAYAVPFGAFIISLVLMTMGLDYGRRLQPLPIHVTRRAVLTPATEAFDRSELISERPAIRRRSSVRRRVQAVA